MMKNGVWCFDDPRGRQRREFSYFLPFFSSWVRKFNKILFWRWKEERGLLFRRHTKNLFLPFKKALCLLENIFTPNEEYRLFSGFLSSQRPELMRQDSLTRICGYKRVGLNDVPAERGFIGNQVEKRPSNLAFGEHAHRNIRPLSSYALKYRQSSYKMGWKNN